MINDSRARSKVREFLFQWLRVDSVPDLAKDPEKYPGFDSAVASDLRTSLELFLEEAVWGETSDYRQLLLADTRGDVVATLPRDPDVVIGGAPAREAHHGAGEVGRRNLLQHVGDRHVVDT